MSRPPHLDTADDRRLALAARPALDDAACERIARAFGDVADWEALITRAEAHGLAPLLRAHLRAAGVRLPAGAASMLLGLAAYHRRRAAAHEGALGDVIDAFARVGIEPLILKGAALARLIYPEPALRPMGDVDLLVAPEDVDRAWQALLALGFEPSQRPPGRAPEKHRVATRKEAGITVSVELHFSLLAPERGRLDPRAVWSSLVATALPFEIAGRSARTLGPTRLLWHLCRHLRGHADVFTPLRLVWMADVIALADRFAAEIDWSEVRAREPEIIRTLGLLDAIIGLTPAARAVAGLGPAPALDWTDFTGWPRQSLVEQRAAGRGLGRIVRETLWPSAGWLRLHHGLAVDQPLAIHRLLHHPREIAGWSVVHLRERAAARGADTRVESSLEGARATDIG